jgi:hypothetical protein
MLAQQLAILRDELDREVAKNRGERDGEIAGPGHDDDPPVKTLAN